MKTGLLDIRLSNENKIIFPEGKITKKQLADYYLSVSELMLPHLHDRPVTMKRFPDGIHEEGFFHKNISGYFPDWIEFYEAKKEKGKTRYALCNNTDTLLYLVNQYSVSFHCWLSLKDKPKCPDRIVFDLDPCDDDFSKIIKAAHIFRKKLEEINLTPYVMTTGSRGLHLVVPVKREFEYKEVKFFAKELCKQVVMENPEILTVEQRKNKRGNNVFADYLRNEFAQTSVVPYSLRPLDSAPAAIPLDWEEVKEGLDPKKFNILNISGRIKSDPWKDFFKKPCSIAKVIHSVHKSF